MNGEKCAFSPANIVTSFPWPWVFYASALVLTVYLMSTGQWFWMSYLRSLVFFNGGIQCLWAAIGHLAFPVQTAQKIGWQSNGFQTEIGGVNLAFGIAGILSLFNLYFLGPVAMMLVIYYSSCIHTHIRYRISIGRKPSFMCYNSIIVVASLIAALAMMANPANIKL